MKYSTNIYLKHVKKHTVFYTTNYTHVFSDQWLIPGLPTSALFLLWAAAVSEESHAGRFALRIMKKLDVYEVFSSFIFSGV